MWHLSVNYLGNGGKMYKVTAEVRTSTRRDEERIKMGGGQGEGRGEG